MFSILDEGDGNNALYGERVPEGGINQNNLIPVLKKRKLWFLLPIIHHGFGNHLVLKVKIGFKLFPDFL